MLIGTNYFVSPFDALRYYVNVNGYAMESAIDIVAKRIRDGDVNIGVPPNLKRGESVVLMDGGTRYGIEDGRAMSEEREYRLRFGGKLRGSIGVMRSFSVTVRASSDQDAVKALYDAGYEHIHLPMELMPDGTTRGPLPYS